MAIAGVFGKLANVRAAALGSVAAVGLALGVGLAGPVGAESQPVWEHDEPEYYECHGYSVDWW
jgi:hypothetical protein